MEQGQNTCDIYQAHFDPVWGRLGRLSLAKPKEDSGNKGWKFAKLTFFASFVICGPILIQFFYFDRYRNFAFDELTLTHENWKIS